MRYSLLYAKGAEPEDVGFSDSIREAIYNLNIDRMVNAACASVINADYFLSALSKPLTDVEDITYRRGIRYNAGRQYYGKKGVYRGERIQVSRRGGYLLTEEETRQYSSHTKNKALSPRMTD